MSTVPLPPGLSASELGAALATFERIVGGEHVHRDDALVAEFADPYGYQPENPYRPSAVVQPGSVEEIQAIVVAAAEHGVPIWTNSQGRNNGYGGGAPRVNGSVVVNLRRMNRILEVDEELGYAVLEPGVTFFDLYNHLRENGYKLWADVPDIGWGSVIGNALDHGYGYTPYGDHASQLCGIEVVLPSGELLRTGMGGLPKSHTWHLQKRGFGPSLDTLFMQSNLGIVVQAGVWLMPQPEVWRANYVYLDEEHQIGALVDALRPLMVSGVINHRVSIANLLARAPSMSRRADWYQGEGPIPPEVLKRMSDETGWAAWNARIGFYGSNAVVDAQLETLREAVKDVPGARLVSRKYAGDVAKVDVEGPDELLAGIPSMHHLNLLKWFGTETGGHIGYAPIAPLRGGDADTLMGLMKEQVAKHGLDFAMAFALQPRSMYLIALIFFDSAEKDMVRRAWDLTESLVRKAGALGYGEYRSHLNFMDLVGDQFSFNDHVQRRVLTTIKDALDPAGVLSPGKQGIWPSAFRTSGDT